MKASLLLLALALVSCAQIRFGHRSPASAPAMEYDAISLLSADEPQIICLQAFECINTLVMQNRLKLFPGKGSKQAVVKEIIPLENQGEGLRIWGTYLVKVDLLGVEKEVQIFTSFNIDEVNETVLYLEKANQLVLKSSKK